MKKRTLILIATYNEAENIEAVLRATLGLKGNFDVLVVDDNSPDGTGEIVKRIAGKTKRVKLISRTGPKGRGLASIEAYKYFYASNYDYICELDADFQEDPNDVIKLVKEAEKGNYDIVLGSRYVAGGGFESNKKWLSLFVNSVIMTMFNTKIKDPTCWFHVVKRDVFDVVPINRLRSKGFFLASELHFPAEKAGLKIKELPYFFPERKEGKTKISIGVSSDFAKEAIRFWLSRKR